MQKNSRLFTTLGLLLATLFVNSSVFAGDIEWSGLYRIEGNKLYNSELRGSDYDPARPNTGKKSVGYGLHHLILRPKITAGDGLTIFGQFDILNSSNYPNSQMGQVWGNGVRTGAATATTSTGNSNALSQTQKAEQIEVSKLYLTYNHEFGQLIVGRAPIHFGLGMTHNAGMGLFDHWYTTRDLVGYKFVVGNMYFLPMIGRPSGGTFNNSDNIDDYMIQVQYENPETDLELGVFYQLRQGGDQGSDAPLGSATPGSVLGGAGSTHGSINTKIVNVYALKDTELFRAGLEASFMSGDSGVIYSNDKVSWSGFGLAFEGEYRPQGSSWNLGVKAGSASGDDPQSWAKYEGYAFNRNYDVAMLMFNHPLGQDDFLRTKLVTGDVYAATGDANRTKEIGVADVEAISNVVYFAPSFKYSFNDRWSWRNTFVTGWLTTNPIPGKSGGKDLGYEWDTSLHFTPRKGVEWINQVGMLLPGSAWKADGTYDASSSIGISTKAAISF